MLYESDQDNKYLQHYGIRGQHWGVRRFQNEDGTLTEAGKDRYYKENVGSEKNGLGRTIIEAIFPKIKERRINKAKKEIEDAKLTDRFDEKEIDHYSKMTNSKFRKQVIQDMQKNPQKKYFDAYRSRLAKNIAISAAMMISAPIITSLVMKNSDKIKNFFDSLKKKPANDILDLTTVETYRPKNIPGIKSVVLARDPRNPKNIMGAPAIDFDQLKKR